LTQLQFLAPHKFCNRFIANSAILAVRSTYMLEVIGAILVGAFALTFGVLSVGPMMLKREDV